MATIRAREKADGSKSYTAQIRIKKNGVQVYTESQTFARKQAAQAWVKRRETELAEPGAIERMSRKQELLGDIIKRYLGEYGKARPLGKTKEATLLAIARSYLGELADSEITSQVLVDYALWRMSPEGGGVQAQTVANDLAHLGAVLGVAQPAWGYEIDERAMPAARKVLKNLGYRLRSRERNRRPTLEELDRMLEHAMKVLRYRPSACAMPKLIAFALFSTRRQEEIIRIRWDDLDAERRAVLVRDMKNPGDKWGNDTWCDLPDEAWAIIESMPRVHAEIFPYTTEAIRGGWIRATASLEIEDLNFHDLRHEGVSRLFECGWDIPRVAGVSGHRNWDSLKRYTHMRGQGDKYAGWKWLQRIIDMPVVYGEWVNRKKPAVRRSPV